LAKEKGGRVDTKQRKYVRNRSVGLTLCSITTSWESKSKRAKVMNRTHEKRKKSETLIHNQIRIVCYPQRMEASKQKDPKSGP
jgi:hypothetical protein